MFDSYGWRISLLIYDFNSRAGWSYKCGIGFVTYSFTDIYTVWVKKISPPLRFSDSFFPNGWEFLVNFFTHLLYVPFYARWQILIQLFPTLTKLCHNKHNHPVNFYISLEH